MRRTEPFCVVKVNRFELIAIIDDQQFSLLCAAPRSEALKGDAKTIFKSLAIDIKANHSLHLESQFYVTVAALLVGDSLQRVNVWHEQPSVAVWLAEANCEKQKKVSSARAIVSYGIFNYFC